MNPSRFFGREVCAVPTCPLLAGNVDPIRRESGAVSASEVTR